MEIYYLDIMSWLNENPFFMWLFGGIGCLLVQPLCKVFCKNKYRKKKTNGDFSPIIEASGKAKVTYSVEKK